MKKHLIIIASIFLFINSNAQNREFFIGMFNESYYSIQQLKELKSYNFTFCIYNESENDDYPSILDTANVIGLKLLLKDSNIHFFENDMNNPKIVPVDSSKIRLSLENNGKKSCVLGYYVDDEPERINFDSIALYFNCIKKYDSTFIRYANLLPMYIEAFRATGNPADSNRGATPADYQNYIQSYIDITSPNILSFDHYPIFLNSQHSLIKHILWPSNFFYNLDIISKKSVENNIPFIYVLCPLDTNAVQLNLPENPKDIIYRYPQTPKDSFEFNYVIFSALIYGVKGLNYWNYDHWNKVTPNVKNYLSGLHKKIIDNQNVLMNLKFAAAYHKTFYSTIPTKQDLQENIPSYSAWNNFSNDVYANEIFNVSNPIQALSGYSIDSIAISFLTDDIENKYFWILNKSMLSTEMLQINLKDGCSIIDIFEGEKCSITENKTITLAPGEAKLFKAFINVNTNIINQSTIWDSKRIIGNNIAVNSTAVLTITDSVLFLPNTQIIVLPGGKLILDGCTLTNACDGELWGGIEVHGTPTSSQNAPWSDQGVVILQNDAVIENAVC
ncbi:MAG: hypothetical protein WDA77_13800, partial [Acidimicrobiia bacterium]